MIGKAKEALDILKSTWNEFSADDCMTLAASLAYYTVFALPPLMFVIVMAMGVIFGPRTVEEQILGQVRAMIGPSASEQMQTALSHVTQRTSQQGWTIGISVAVLVFSATGVFIQLQAALNRAWGVAPDPKQGGIKNFILKRILSLGMILGVAFLFLVSLTASTVISAVGRAFSGLLPGGMSEVFLFAMDFLLSLIIFPILFAIIFKWMPDAKVQWRDVWVGSFVTALLFILGKFAIGFYLGRSDVAETYGAAGALAVIMLWVYYASLIVLIGAEFTQIWARRYGSAIEPENGAVKVVREERPLHEKSASAG